MPLLNASEIRGQFAAIGVLSDEQIDNMVSDAIRKGTAIDDESDTSLDSTDLDAAADDLAKALGSPVNKGKCDEPDDDDSDDDDPDPGDDDPDDDDDDSIEDVAKALVAEVVKRLPQGSKGSDRLLKAIGQVNFELAGTTANILTEIRADRRERAELAEKLGRIEKALGESPGFKAVTSAVEIIPSPFDEPVTTTDPGPGGPSVADVKKFGLDALRKAHSAGDHAEVKRVQSVFQQLDRPGADVGAIAKALNYQAVQA